MKWAYKVIYRECFDEKGSTGQILEKMGNQGWELCVFSGIVAGDCTMIFKRPKS